MLVNVQCLQGVTGNAEIDHSVAQHCANLVPFLTGYWRCGVYPAAAEISAAASVVTEVPRMLADRR
jgi:hypothetical protein